MNPFVSSDVFLVKCSKNEKVIERLHSTKCNICLSIIKVLLLVQFKTDNNSIKGEALNFVYCAGPS